MHCPLVHFLQASFKCAFMLLMNERLLTRAKEGSRGLPFMFVGDSRILPRVTFIVSPSTQPLVTAL